jgi:hypothetical protein
VIRLLGTGDGNDEKVEGLFLDGGGAGEDGEGSIGGEGSDDRVARQGGQIGKQGLKAVDGAPTAVRPEALLASASGERCALATGVAREASAACRSSSS